ncbi:MAG: M23 family metallopeptidase [Defluviitaleaceae bacterium]|nr:M23 family metallopeptidase [Defluviitaleaceae bacterium]MCL2262231.1 M23 family metallopeptidase [Defluviitaleaceae bacterium]
MFSKFFKSSEKQNRPAVKKVGEFVNFKPRKEKKYISLMAVPSYSGAKTRSLSIPYTVFYGAVFSVFIVSALVIGFYLSAIYFENMTHTLIYTLEETREDFDEYRVVAAHRHDYLLDNSMTVYEQLNNEQNRAQSEVFRQEIQHQGDFNYMQSVIYNMERQIRDFETERLQILELLERRAVQIPPVASTVRRLTASQESLAYELFNGETTRTEPPELAGLVLGARTPVTEEELHERLELLAAEMEIQRLLFDNMETYRAGIDAYLRNFPTLMPIAGGVITSWFGTRRDPITGLQAFHEGVDIPAPSGTPIMAAGGGIVTYSGFRGGYGNVVFIDHGGGLQTRYAHNTRNLVYVGERVERGQIIAHVGSTGRSLSPHLHYEVLRNGSHVNPVTYIHE